MDTLSIVTLVLASATFILAGMAFWTIQQNYRIHTKKSKVELLDRILEWTLEIQTNSLKVNIPLTTELSSSQIGRNAKANSLLRYGITFAKNEYIRAIARTAFRQELAGEVDNTINTFTAFLYLKGKEFGMQNPRESFRGTAIPIIDGVEREIGSDPKMLNDLLAKYNERIATAANSLLIKVGKVASGLC